MCKYRSYGLLAAISVCFLTSCASVKPADQASETFRIDGAKAKFGQGSVESFALINAEGVPQAIGIWFSNSDFEQVPPGMSDGHRCYDANADNSIDHETECLHWHESVLPLPAEISRRDDIPFKWILLNWNPKGHMPEGVWNTPHFDVHFYIESIEKIFALMPGPCGPETMRCDQYDAAIKPVPANYIHEDFVDVGAAAPAMGNHLVDPTAPEFAGAPFTRSWIYGSYDGKIIFWEEMLSVEYLKSHPDECFPIKTPRDVEISGYYPTSICTRYDPESTGTSVSMENFELRKANSAVALEE